MEEAEAINPLLMGSAGRQDQEADVRLAFDALARENRERLYRVLLGIVGDPDAAATLTQDCLLKAYLNLGSFRGEANVRTWLVRIAINAGRDHLRSRRWQFWKRLRSSGGDEDALRLPDMRSSAEGALIAREQVARVWRVVEGMSERQREVFTLRFAEEMSLQEIAEATGLSLASTKVHLFRAVHAVRQAVGKEKP